MLLAFFSVAYMPDAEQTAVSLYCVHHSLSLTGYQEQSAVLLEDILQTINNTGGKALSHQIYFIPLQDGLFNTPRISA